MNQEEWEAQVEENWVEPLDRIRKDAEKALAWGLAQLPMDLVRPVWGILEKMELVRVAIEASNARKSADLAENDDDPPPILDNDPGRANVAPPKADDAPDGDRERS